MLNESKIDKILNAAEQVFAEKSIYKARVTEIAKIAGVSEGTVYEYFGNKEKLMLSIPERHLQRLTENIPELFEIKNPMRRLRRFIKYYFYNFSSNQNFLKTFLMQIQFTPQFYKTDQFKHFLNFFQIFEEIIKEGSSQGCFSPDINPRVFRNMLIGIFNNLTLRWFAQDNKNLPVDKTKKIDDVTNMLCFVATNFDKPPITMLYEGE
jgi:TetR/AcrR family fatty acid metabolism transcriptional regulator